MRRHLVIKLGAVLIFTIGVGFVVPAILNLRYQLERSQNMQTRWAANIAKGLAAGVRSAMLSGNAMTARYLVRDARESIEGVRVLIYAPNGEEVFAEHNGPPPKDQIPPHVKLALEQKAEQRSASGGRVLPIANDARCETCHGESAMRGVLTLATQGAKRQLQGAEDTSDILTRVIASPYIQLMTADRTDDLGSYFTDVGKQLEGVEGITVVDAWGDPSLGATDLMLPKAELRAALKDLQPRYVPPRPKRRRRPGQGARYILPLKNEKRCHSCHDEKESVRGAVVLAFDDVPQVPQELLSSAVRVGLDHVMLSGLGRLIRNFLVDVAATEAVSELTLHDRSGRLYKDALVKPVAPPDIDKVLQSGQPFFISHNGVGEDESFTYIEPLHNGELCQRCHGDDHRVRGAIEVTLDTTQEAATRVRIAQTGLIFGVGTVLAVLCTLFLGLRLLVLRPVSQIGDVADRVALGELDAAVKIRTVDEIGRLGERINQMVIELRKKLALSKFVSGATMASIDRSQGTVERRGVREYVTVLFSDIRGFTAFSENRQPEEVVDMLNRYLHVQAQAVHTYGGDIDKFVGDELMAYFSGEDAERRATQAAVRMVEAVLQLNAEQGALQMAVGVGVNCGEVIFGAMGAEDRMDFTVIGDAVNLGARLCSAAAKHQVLISGAVRERVGELPGFELQALEPIKVKGKQKPVEIYSVRRSRA